MAVKNHDAKTLKKVLDENIEWTQSRNNAVSGTKKGLKEVFGMSKKINEMTFKSFQLINFKVLATGNNEVICELHFKAFSPEGDSSPLPKLRL